MLDTVTDIMAKSRKCVILTGAGISAESGVPTFRGKDGLWNKFRPEELATMSAFMSNPKIVWEWYNWRRELMSEVSPNPGHYAIVDLENLYSEFWLVTQNVDNLHRKVGSKNILELHGNIHKNKCVDCGTAFDERADIPPDDIPTCDKCGGKIRPDVVWFGEMLDERIISKAFQVSEAADVFLSVGTSALIHPAASLPVIAKQRGAILIEVNLDPTPLTDLADYSFREKTGEFLPPLVEELRKKMASRL